MERYNVDRFFEADTTAMASAVAVCMVEKADKASKQASDLRERKDLQLVFFVRCRNRREQAWHCSH